MSKGGKDAKGDGKGVPKGGKDGKDGKGEGKDAQSAQGPRTSRRRLSFGPEAGIEPLAQNRSDQAPEAEASTVEPEVVSPMSNADFRKLMMG